MVFQLKHNRTTDMENSYDNKVVGITGALGFIGQNLTNYLQSQGFLVIPLNRNFNSEDLKKCNILINLAGATINKRWSKSYKKEILDSRLNTTRKITSFIKANNNISLLINASAVGIYSTESKEPNDEFNYVYGNDFLANVCHEWESEALSVKELTKVVIVRFGLVMSNKGGALPKMMLPTKYGVATILGKGDQIVSWIMLEDLVRAIKFIIENSITGVINLCSPNPISNRDLTKEIAKKQKSLIITRVPAFILKLVMGEASSLILKGQQVTSKRLNTSSFKFNHPTFSL